MVTTVRDEGKTMLSLNADLDYYPIYCMRNNFVQISYETSEHFDFKKLDGSALILFEIIKICNN